MYMKKALRILLLFFLAGGQFTAEGLQGIDEHFPKEVYKKRRQALMNKIGEGTIILFAGVREAGAAYFRQDNDFYYFTGLEDPNAVLIMDAARKRSSLYFMQQTGREDFMHGKNLLGTPDAAKITGVNRVRSLDWFHVALSFLGAQPDRTVYIRLSGRDTEAHSRRETQLLEAVQTRNRCNAQLPLEKHRVITLRNLLPNCTFKDINPYIDRLRLIKTPREIAVLRRNGKLSARAHMDAIRATRVGMYEYEIAGTAMGAILKGGARGPAYPVGVGSGPNSCIPHYDKNTRRIEAGDLVLMDFGADLEHLCMDITRTWPASGRFTPEQREAYRAVLEVQKAVIAALRPGATPEDIRKNVEKVKKEKNLKTYPGLTGRVNHYVGLATHDVGPRGIPLEAGMVLAIEPGVYLSEKNLGIRIEDTVLITPQGHEILSSGVPKEIEDIETLLEKRGQKKN